MRMVAAAVSRYGGRRARLRYRRRAAVVGKLFDGVGRILIMGVAVTLVSTQERSQLLRIGGDVEVICRQYLGLAGIEPFLGLLGVAFRTGSVFAGVIRAPRVCIDPAPRCPPASVRLTRMSAMARRCEAGISLPWPTVRPQPAEDVGKLYTATTLQSPHHLSRGF